MKKNIFVSVAVLFFCSAQFSLSAKNDLIQLKRVYIKNFKAGDGIVQKDAVLPGSDGSANTTLNTGPKDNLFLSSDNIANEIKDYMSEVFVTKDEFTLISDDEIRMELEDMKKRQLIGIGDDSVEAGNLIEKIDADYLVYGTIYIRSGEYVIEASLLEFSEQYGAHEKNRGEIKFKKDIYVDRASRAMAEYLLLEKKDMKGFFGKKNPLDEFYNDMNRLEKDINKMMSEFEAGKSSIMDASARRNAYLSSSSLIRFGYGGFGLAPVGGFYPVESKDKILPKYYDSGHEAVVDYYWSRSKDPVGDGIDLFLRGVYREYPMNGSALTDITPNFGTADNVIGRYNPIPLEKGKLVNYGGDLGIRFVGAAYFLYEAWSIYLSGAVRYLYVTETYTGALNKEISKSFSAWGYSCGLGLEVSLFSFLGLFAEMNYGYVPIGNDEVNIDGLKLFYGVTFRTNHWNF